MAEPCDLHTGIQVMKRSIILSAFLALGLADTYAGLIPRLPNDPDFVALGRNRGYYMVPSDSAKWWHWGLVRAPVEEPRMFTQGFGDDAIAIPLDASGRVAFAPVYIYTIRPEGLGEAASGGNIRGCDHSSGRSRAFWPAHDPNPRSRL